MSAPLLSAAVSVSYGGNRVLEKVELDIAEGEAVAVVGQSGSGKSTLGLALLNLLDRSAASVTGTVMFKGRNLLEARGEAIRSIRGKEIALVLQSAASALNPVLTVESHLREAWSAHSSLEWKKARSGALDLLGMLSLPDEDAFLMRRPRQISVGQAQRVLIAMALLHGPSLVIADEPTSALDPPTAREALDCLRIAHRSRSAALLLITHDVASVPELCDRVVVLHQGRVVEQGKCSEVFRNPTHPATQRLLGGACVLQQRVRCSEALFEQNL